LLDGIDAGVYNLVVQDANGCELDTTFTMVCLELVPPTPNEFISPNNDGLNEAWFIDNILYYTEATVQVYNRWGVEVYRAEPPYLNDWDGTNKQGQVLPSATYFYVIDTKKKSQKPFTGFLELQTEKP
jgi:gliding motility-associated-like protein